MEAMLGFVGATVLGAGGWWIGEQVGFMTAFVLSTVASGVGLYAGRRIARDYLS